MLQDGLPGTSAALIELHSRPLLRELHEQMERRYDLLLPPPPSPGSLDLDGIRDAQYFFS